MIKYKILFFGNQGKDNKKDYYLSLLEIFKLEINMYLTINVILYPISLNIIVHNNSHFMFNNGFSLKYEDN